MAGNMCCRVCLELTLEERANIDTRLLSGERYKSIVEDYPQLNRYVLSNHLRHMGNPESECNVAALRLARENAQLRMQDFNCESFIVELRERLKRVIFQSQELVEEYLEDTLDNERAVDELNSAISAQQKLLHNLDTVSGIKSLINLNAAFAAVTKEGYTISANGQTVASKPD